MELLSACPLRVSAAIISVGPFLELRSVVRATFDVGRGGVLDLSARPVDPEGDDCAFLHQGDAEVTVSHDMWRKIVGRDMGDGAHFEFEGAP